MKKWKRFTLISFFVPLVYTIMFKVVTKKWLPLNKFYLLLFILAFLFVFAIQIIENWLYEKILYEKIFSRFNIFRGLKEAQREEEKMFYLLKQIRLSLLLIIPPLLILEAMDKPFSGFSVIAGIGVITTIMVHFFLKFWEKTYSL